MMLQNLMRWKNLRKPQTVLVSIITVTLRGNLHVTGINIHVSKSKEKGKTLPDRGEFRTYSNMYDGVFCENN